MVRLLTLEKSDTAPKTVFFVVLLMMHLMLCKFVLLVMLYGQQSCMISQFVFVFVLFFLNWSSYDSDPTGFSYIMHTGRLFSVPMETCVKKSAVMVCCINVYLGTLF